MTSESIYAHMEDIDDVNSPTPCASSSSQSSAPPPQDTTAPPVFTHNEILNIFANIGLGMSQLTTAVQAATAPQPQAPLVVPRSGGVKFREPREFNGQASEVEHFIYEIENAFRWSPAQFTTDESKACYLGAYLKAGSPFEWLMSVERARPTLILNWAEFKKEFISHFGISDIHGTYLRKLENLSQTGSAAQYFARFHDIVSHLHLTKDSKITYLKRGLKPKVREHLIGKKYATLAEYEPIVIHIDNDLFNSKQDERRVPVPQFKSTPTPSTSTSTSTFTPIPGTETVPMEVDATRTVTHLTADERKRRFTNNLCLYCAGAGHRADACPVKAAKLSALGKAKAL